MHLDGDAGDSGKCTRSSDHALIADQYVRLPHKNNQRARIAELRTRTLARAPNRAREARSGRWRTTERPSTHSTHSNTLDLRRKARAWCFLELCRNPTTTTPHAQGASGYTKLVRRRALYRALGDLPGNAGRWLLGRSPLRSRCEVVRGKHWRNSNLLSGPRLRRSKKLTPRAAERARPQQERAREALWLTRSSTVLTRHPRCCTSLWLMLPGRTWKGCTWRPVPMRHQSSSTGWTSTESAMI